jgi:hypothetical protein
MAPITWINIMAIVYGINIIIKEYSPASQSISKSTSKSTSIQIFTIVKFENIFPLIFSLKSSFRFTEFPISNENH